MIVYQRLICAHQLSPYFVAKALATTRAFHPLEMSINLFPIYLCNSRLA